MAIEEKDKKISLLLEDLASLQTYINDIFVFSPLPLCFVSPTGVLLETNPAFEKFSRFSFNEIIGKPIEELFDKKEIEQLVRDTLEKGLVEGRKMRFFPKGKKEKPTQVFTRRRKEKGGQTVGYFLGLFDLTKIKETEKELRKRVEELEKFHGLTVGRELKMIELKKRIKKLENKLKL